MVMNATSLTRSGLKDFLLQRVTAIILALYTLCVVGFVLVTPDVSHASWSAYHATDAMRLFSTLALLSTAAHAWIGMWTVGTDYIRPAHVGGQATLLRGLYQLVCLLALFVYLGWGLQIFWGI